MNTPIPPKCLSSEINDVTGSMILLRLVFLRSRLEFEHFLPTGLGVSAFAKGLEVYHLGMSRMRPVLDPDHSRAVDALILEEPEDEEGEDEEEHEGVEDEDGDEGYSE
jgi:hypothetical protein